MDRTFPCVLAVLAASLASCGRNGTEAAAQSLLAPVTRGDLVVTVRERGEIKAARDTRVSSALEGRATLIYLIPEGSVVAAGDKVAELDVSTIQEKRALQAISVAKAAAGVEQARKNVEIVEKELQALAKTAETRHRIAQLRLEKFFGQASRAGGGAEPAAGTNEEMVARLRGLIGEDAPDSATRAQRARLLERLLELLGDEEHLRFEMGEMANLVLQQIDEISLARADLELAKETLFYSRKLKENGFITANQLQRDEISYSRQLSRQTLAWNNLLLLVNYQLPESLIDLELEVENALLALESTRAANEARRVREQAELKSIEAEYALAKAQLENWDEQIGNGVLRAPAAGLVVYARMDWDEPVYEGMEVRERQEIVILPDVSSMMVELKIPEAQIGRVAAGQRATVRVDAFPSRGFAGRVVHVSTLPEPGPLSQVLKLYVARVLIDGDNPQGALRPGMNGAVTIEVGTIEDVINVPLPALERRGDAHFVWKHTPQGPAASPVELGVNNLTHVQVLAGLDEGDRIYLVRPPGVQLPAAAEPSTTAPPQELEVSRGDPAGSHGASGSR